MSTQKPFVLWALVVCALCEATLRPISAQELPAPLLPSAEAALPLRAQTAPYFEPGETANSALPREAYQSVDMVQFDDVPLSEALKTFSEQTKLNVIASSEAGKTKITVYLRQVSAIAVLDAIVKTNGLFYRVDPQSGIIRIATADEYETDLATFREEQTRVFTLLYPNPMAVAHAIQHIYGGRVQVNLADSDFSELIDLTQRLSRFDLIDGRSLGLGNFQNTGQIQGFAGRNLGGGAGFGLNRGFGGGGLGLGMGRTGLGGGIGMMGGGLGGGLGILGGGMGGLQGQNNQFNDPTLFDLNTELNEEMSAEQIQMLEAQMASNGKLDADTLNKLLERGKKTIQISVIRRNNQIVVRTADPKTMQQICELITQLDVPTPLVLLEVKIMRVSLGDGFQSAFDYQFGTANGTAGQFVSLNANGQNSQIGPFNNAIAQTPNANLPQSENTNPGNSQQLGGNGVIPGAFAFQIVDSHFKARMQLLDSKSRVTSLASPLILTANNEVSQIFVGDSVPITSGFNANIINNNAVGNGQTVQGQANTQLADIGQSLLITPNINADRTVSLRLIVEVSKLVTDGGRIPVQNINGTVTQTNVDTVNRSKVTGTIVAQDGNAVVLGGLIEEQVEDIRQEVPILGRIPVLGFFFRRQTTGRTRNELVVVIRPYVFNTPSESAATSHQLMSELSLHPNSPDARGTMNTFLPCEIVRPNPDCCDRANLFKLHSVTPTIY